jgi:lambda repressor-like predicted transcriptional regulator
MAHATAEFCAPILKAYEQSSQAIKDVGHTMAQIINDPESDYDARVAAADTLMEALFPTYSSDGYGVDLEELIETDDQGKPLNDEDGSRKEEVFANKVRKLMKEKRVTQGELAKTSGVGQSAVAMFLSRGCRPQRATVQKIAEALGVKSDELWPK